MWVVVSNVMKSYLDVRLPLATPLKQLTPFNIILDNLVGPGVDTMNSMLFEETEIKRQAKLRGDIVSECLKITKAYDEIA